MTGSGLSRAKIRLQRFEVFFEKGMARAWRGKSMQRPDGESGGESVSAQRGKAKATKGLCRSTESVPRDIASEVCKLVKISARTDRETQLASRASIHEIGGKEKQMTRRSRDEQIGEWKTRDGYADGRSTREKMCVPRLTPSGTHKRRGNCAREYENVCTSVCVPASARESEREREGERVGGREGERGRG
eukprot:6180848-Pleurochrysis_carterae.AAC.4